MPGFKLKISLGNANIELEGDNELFSDLKTAGLGKLEDYLRIDGNLPLNKVENNTLENAPVESSENSLISPTDTSMQNAPLSFPSLSTVVAKDLCSSEREWVLIFAFYKTNFNGGIFSKSAIKDMYDETGRKTPTRLKNFVNNIRSLVNADYLTLHNNEECVLTPKGIQRAIEILSQQNNGKNNGSQKKKKTKVVRQAETYDLGLTEKEQTEFIDFYLEHKPESNKGKLVLISYWLKKYKDMEVVNTAKISAALQAISEPAFGIGDTFRNAKNHNKYFISIGGKGDYKLSNIGIGYVENTLLKAE